MQQSAYEPSWKNAPIFRHREGGERGFEVRHVAGSHRRPTAMLRSSAVQTRIRTYGYRLSRHVQLSKSQTHIMFCDAKLLHINFRMGIEASLMSLWVTLSRSIGIWVSSVELSRRWKGNAILSVHFLSIRSTDLEVPNPTLGVMFFGCHLFYPALLMIPVRS